MALVAFALVPPPWNAVCLFFNGLPLGMIFGLILGFLEGRRMTEALAAALCASFILADGVTKSVGAWLLAAGISQYWMPSVAGLLFFAPLALFVSMLSQIPPPDAGDIAARSIRSPMSRAESWALATRYGFGIALIATIYFAVTIVRSLRADFATELWQSLGAPAAPQTFTLTEILVMLGVSLVNGCAVVILDNRRAFFTALATCGLGAVLLIVALVLRQSGGIGGF